MKNEVGIPPNDENAGPPRKKTKLAEDGEKSSGKREVRNQVLHQKELPKGGPKSRKKEKKRCPKNGMVSGPFPEGFSMISGMKKGGKIMKILSGMRSGNENGDFSRNVLFCRRQHENRGSGTSKIDPESGKKRSRDEVGDRGAFRE